MAAPQTSDNTTYENQPDDGESSVYVADADTTAPDPTPEQPAEKPSGTKAAGTRGGIPALPLLSIGTSSTVTAVSSAGLVAGPAAAAVVAGSIAAVATVAAATRAPRARRKAAAAARTTKAASTTGNRAAGTPVGRGFAAHAARAGQTAAHRSVGTAARTGQRSASIPAQTARQGVRAASGLGRVAGGPGAVAGAAQAARQRAEQIRTARAEAAGLPRSQRRQEQTTARRQVADARREAKARAKEAAQQRKAAERATAGQAANRAGRISTTASGVRGRVGDWRDRQRQARRLVADTKAQGRVDARRAAVKEKARLRKAAAESRARSQVRRSRLRRSAARFHGRRFFAALVALPVGVLSTLASWPLRAMGFRAPHWGRRIYRAIAGTALTARQARDWQIEQAAAVAEADAQAQAAAQPDPSVIPETGPVPDIDPAAPTVADPNVNNPTANTTPEGNTMGIFDFRQSAEDMNNQAQAGEIDGMLAVLNSIETMPEAITYIANSFAAVADKLSPENAPLDPAVNESLMEVYQLLNKAVEAAEEVAKTFNERHEPEIARLKDQRVNEEMWDVSRNADEA